MGDKEKKSGGLLGRLGKKMQPRARRTRRTILETARERFNRSGFDKTPIKEIAAEANVSVGAIYEHFRDKRTLLKEVGQMEARRLQDEAFGPFRKALAQMDANKEGDRPALEEVVRLGIRGTLDSQRRYPRLLAELVDVAYRDREFFAFVEEVTEEAVTFVKGLLIVFGARKPGPQAELSARILVLMCESTIRKFTLYGDALSEDALIEEMTTLVMRYLFDPGSGR